MQGFTIRVEGLTGFSEMYCSKNGVSRRSKKGKMGEEMLNSNNDRFGGLFILAGV